MDSILELLFALPPSELHYAPDSEYAATKREKENQYKALIAALMPDQQERLEQYLDAAALFESAARYDSFRYAFHFGVLLAAELTRGKQELLG